MKEIINELLSSSKVMKHGTYEHTGIVAGDCVSAVNGLKYNFYIMPYEDEQIEVVASHNVHFGYATYKDGKLFDNSNRDVFTIV